MVDLVWIHPWGVWALAKVVMLAIGIDTNIEFILVSLTTWEAHHSPRAKPGGGGGGGGGWGWGGVWGGGVGGGWVGVGVGVGGGGWESGGGWASNAINETTVTEIEVKFTIIQH